MQAKPTTQLQTPPWRPGLQLNQPREWRRSLYNGALGPQVLLSTTSHISESLDILLSYYLGAICPHCVV